jgi:hypothetical protein
MLAKIIMTGSLTLLFGWQTVASASSISARVNVFGDKLTQFERQMNELKAQQVNQKQATEEKDQRIQSIVSRLNQLEDQIYQGVDSTQTNSYPPKAGRYQPTNSSKRFTDQLYAYP